MKYLMLLALFTQLSHGAEPCEAFLDTVVQRLDDKTYMILRNGELPAILKARTKHEAGQWVINAKKAGRVTAQNRMGFEQEYPVYKECKLNPKDYGW